jgi:CheY-like chemotaxis protein
MQPDRPTTLVVEDHALVCEMLQILLDVGGYTAEYVADGPRTLDRLARGDVDLLRVRQVFVREWWGDQR